MENDHGFASLCQLLTKRHRDPGFDLERAVVDHGRGLTTLTDSPELLTAWREAGLAPTALLAGKPDGAGLRLKGLARRLGLAAAAVPDSYFLDPADHFLHRTMRAIETNTSLSVWTRPKPHPRAPFWPGPAITLTGSPPGRGDRATHEIAERLEFIPRPRIIMPPWDDPDGRDATTVLREKAYRGARRRYGPDLLRPWSPGWNTS